MLRETFLFLPGVQERTEQRLWQSGIATWDHLLDTSSVPGVSRERLSFWKSRIRQLQQALESPARTAVLRRMFGSRYVWRAVKEFMDEPRFLDIETTEYCKDITVIGISDGEFYQAFVKGKNLETQRLRNALEGATCLVTFNGSSFDLPIIERNYPGVLPDVPHIDLRHVCAQAGLRGGLKKIEQQLQISRVAAIRDKDGADAIMLWYRYQLGEEEALQDLIDYNAADVLNLQPLLQVVVPALWQKVRHGRELPFESVSLNS